MELQLGIVIAQLLIRYGPALTEEIAVLLHSSTPPTLEQWQAVFKKCKSLDQYVAEAKLKVGGTGGTGGVAVVP